MRIGHLGPLHQEVPVVFENESTAINVESIISNWSRDTLENNGLERVKAADLSGLPRLDVSTQRIGAPISRPTKIVCIGLNYKKHAEETGAAKIGRAHV